MIANVEGRVNRESIAMPFPNKKRTAVPWRFAGLLVKRMAGFVGNSLHQWWVSDSERTVTRTVLVHRQRITGGILMAEEDTTTAAYLSYHEPLNRALVSIRERRANRLSIWKPEDMSKARILRILP